MSVVSKKLIHVHRLPKSRSLKEGRMFMNDIDIIDLIIQYLKILKKHLKQKNK